MFCLVLFVFSLSSVYFMICFVLYFVFCFGAVVFWPVFVLTFWRILRFDAKTRFETKHCLQQYRSFLRALLLVLFLLLMYSNIHGSAYLITSISFAIVSYATCYGLVFAGIDL